MVAFSGQTNYNLGVLNSTPVQRNDFLQSGTFENDSYRFDIFGTANINLSLNNISAGDDADLHLYRDSNGNGLLDTTDQLVWSSTNSSNGDDSINYRATSGTYFARVNLYNGGSDGRLTYDLDLSATATGQASNLLPIERQFGNLYGDVTFFNRVDNTDTTDTFAFSLGLYEGVNLRLSGLSSDADIRLIKDSNNNRIVDAGEVLRTSTLGGTSVDQISSINDSGNYFVQVYQYIGETNYQLTFDHYPTTFA
jgi:hypothetical protein